MAKQAKPKPGQAVKPGVQGGPKPTVPKNFGNKQRVRVKK